ncbi:oxidoreductase [Halalkalibacter wakoensis JCM 9140]|uniref:Oxidoreductase n=1 Tax=Halalkalibacter wakoensis JCM 9140 TaxID=1236970 RepID=W4Q3P4_9BACI|nr:oxidoreductase [Halalkalibacter wakoensis JCM 9140]
MPNYNDHQSHHQHMSNDHQKLDQIKHVQQMFENNKQEHPYPLYPNYGKIVRNEEIPLNVPEQRQLRHPGVEDSWYRNQS